MAAGPAVTVDGATIEVAANIGTPAEAAGAVAAGADGVGLFRTEFLFMGRDAMPDEDEQTAAYVAAAEALAGRPLLIRTLDAGADKPIPYLGQDPEANPFLGVRGLRLGLARPELLAAQLRAVVRVAEAGHRIRVMFPMVATLDELLAGRAALEEARGRTGSGGAARGRHHDRGARRGPERRRARRARGLLLDRHERPDAVHRWPPTAGTSTWRPSTTRCTRRCCA